MFTARLPKWLEKDLEEFAIRENKTKSAVVVDALIHYLYFFHGYKRPKVIWVKPELKETKRSLELIFDLPENIREDKIKIIEKKGIISLVAVGKESKIFYSRIRLPCATTTSRIIRKKRNKVLILIRKETNLRDVRVL